MTEPVHTQSKIGKYYHREYRATYNFRGFRNFNKLLKHIHDLWKDHGIQVTITNINMICYPYISFEVENERDIALIEVYIKSIVDTVKDQDICGSCSCKGHMDWWERYQKDKNTPYFMRDGLVTA